MVRRACDTSSFLVRKDEKAFAAGRDARDPVLVKLEHQHCCLFVPGSGKRGRCLSGRRWPCSKRLLSVRRMYLSLSRQGLEDSEVASAAVHSRLIVHPCSLWLLRWLNPVDVLSSTKLSNRSLPGQENMVRAFMWVVAWERGISR